MRRAMLTGILVAGLLAAAELGCGRAREAGSDLARTSAPAAEGGAFDCTRASSPVARAVCGDAGLAALDRELGAAWSAALAKWSDHLDQVAREKESAWRATRDACVADADPRACLEASYRRRLVVVQIEGGLLAAAPPIELAGAGHEADRFAVVHFAATEPPSAVVTWAGRQVIALAEPAASGTKYVAPEFELREHPERPGETTVSWSGDALTCRPRG